MAKRLSIIGCGRVGTTLARLFDGAAVFTIHEILNRSVASGEKAVRAIGGGHVVRDLNLLTEADIFLIGTPDDEIPSVAEKLAQLEVVSRQIVFHCSGALSSHALLPLKKRGCEIASVHPIKTFAEPLAAAATFPGTFCAIEGDSAAITVLTDAIAQLKGRVIAIKPEGKMAYHAAFAFSCAYITTLLDVANALAKNSGMRESDAREAIASLAGETVQTVSKLGAGAALTGPIARGDVKIIQEHLAALRTIDPEIAKVYSEIGKLTSQLVERSGRSTGDTQKQIQKILEGR